jgi:hypothetical protein
MQVFGLPRHVIRAGCAASRIAAKRTARTLPRPRPAHPSEHTAIVGPDFIGGVLRIDDPGSIKLEPPIPQLSDAICELCVGNVVGRFLPLPVADQTSHPRRSMLARQLTGSNVQTSPVSRTWSI